MPRLRDKGQASETTCPFHHLPSPTHPTVHVMACATLCVAVTHASCKPHLFSASRTSSSSHMRCIRLRTPVMRSDSRAAPSGGTAPGGSSGGRPASVDRRLASALMVSIMELTRLKSASTLSSTAWGHSTWR